MDARLIPLEASQTDARLVPLDDPMVNQSVAEKAGAGTQAVQVSQTQAQAYDAYQRLLHMSEDTKRRREHWRKEASPGSAALMSGGLNAIDMSLATPFALADLATYPIRSGFQGVNTPPEERAKLTGPFMQYAPNANDVMGKLTGAGADSVEADRDAISAEFPVTSMAGEIGTDVLGLMTGKMPLANAARKLETKSAARIHKAEEIADKTADKGYVASRAEAQTRRMWKRPLALRAKRWAGRSAEAGLEGFMLSAIKGGDPLETAALTGGIQAGLGAIEGTAKHRLKGLPKRGLLGFAAQALAMGVVLQAGSKLLPGEAATKRDYEARDAAIEKALVAAGMGITASILAGRTRTGAGNWLGTARNQMIDGITSVPRYTMASVLTKILDKPPTEREALVAKLNNMASGQYVAESLSPDFVKGWNKALRQGADQAVDYLMRN